MNEGIQASFVHKFDNGPEISVEDLRASQGGRITVLFGASGAGKTTVLRCLAGFERPRTGFIRFDGEVWFDSQRRVHLPPKARRLGFVPQEYALFPHLSVARNIGYGLAGSSPTARRQRVEELLNWLGIEELRDRRPGELSGGQQQRVALARAVAPHPRLLLLDEPLSALDAPARTRLRGQLRRLLTRLDIPSLLVTHDRTEALALGDEMLVMDAGRVIQRGPVHEVFSRPASLAAAGIVAMETVQPGQILGVEEGLATVAVGHRKLLALAVDLPPGIADVYVCIRAENVILARAAAALSSSRNSFSGAVRKLAREGPMVRIDLECGFPLAALLTRQACDELGLAEGTPVQILIKAPNIHLIPRGEGG